MASSKAAVCQCSTWTNKGRTQCDCKREIQKNWTLCRPCALGWHGPPCEKFVRNPAWVSGWPWNKDCLRCGHDSALHQHDDQPPRPEEVELSDWGPKLTPKEFRDSGLLWAVNEYVLWPLGIAIGVDPASEDPDAPLNLLRLAAPETIVAGEIDLDVEPGNLHPAERFRAYARERMGRMAVDEASLARERLNRLARR